MKIIIFFLILTTSLTVGSSIGNTVSRIKIDGYPVEEHTVITPDGYILTMHRIPFSPHHINHTNTTNIKPPIYLQHGLSTSSSDWVISGPKKSLAYLLSDAGYDVWLGNSRGNKYSNEHITFELNSRDYWNFSWHEIGLLDVSSMIDYILMITKNNSLHYIGHSQGTTVFFVLMSLRPEYNKKIISMHAYAPVAYMSNAKSPILKILSPILGDNSALTDYIGSTSLSPSLKLLTSLGAIICEKETIVQEVCANSLFLVCGYDSKNLNMTLLPDILANIPSGASINQVIHYAQVFKSQEFRMYDHGIVKNIIKYKQFSPPEYNLKKISSPVHLYYGENDWMSASADVHILASKLGNLKLNYRVPFIKWNHLDFLWGITAKELLYDYTIRNIEKYN